MRSSDRRDSMCFQSKFAESSWRWQIDRCCSSCIVENTTRCNGFLAQWIVFCKKANAIHWVRSLKCDFLVAVCRRTFEWMLPLSSLKYKILNLLTHMRQIYWQKPYKFKRPPVGYVLVTSHLLPMGMSSNSPLFAHSTPPSRQLPLLGLYTLESDLTSSNW